MADESTNKIRVIVCRPDERAEIVEIEDKLEAMQDLVGGLIQEYMPWVIICNLGSHQLQA